MELPLHDSRALGRAARQASAGDLRADSWAGAGGPLSRAPGLTLCGADLGAVAWNLGSIEATIGAGLARRLEVVSATSFGGAMALALAAVGWSRDRRRACEAARFAAEVAGPALEWLVGEAGELEQRRGESWPGLAAVIEAGPLGDARLGELAGGMPTALFLGHHPGSGALVRFAEGWVRCWPYGRSEAAGWPLAEVVALCSQDLVWAKATSRAVAFDGSTALSAVGGAEGFVVSDAGILDPLGVELLWLRSERTYVSDGTSGCEGGVTVRGSGVKRGLEDLAAPEREILAGFVQERRDRVARGLAAGIRRGALWSRAESGFAAAPDPPSLYSAGREAAARSLTRALEEEKK